MRAMLREKRSISTDGWRGGVGPDGGWAAAAWAAAAWAAAVWGASAGTGATGVCVVFSSMRFPPGRLVLRTLILGLVILLGINLFEAILTDSDLVVHCSVVA